MSDEKREREDAAYGSPPAIAAYLTEVLHAALHTVFTEEGVRLWIADAERKGWSLTEQLERVNALAEGVFS